MRLTDLTSFALLGSSLDSQIAAKRTMGAGIAAAARCLAFEAIGVVPRQPCKEGAAILGTLTPQDRRGNCSRRIQADGLKVAGMDVIAPPGRGKEL